VKHKQLSLKSGFRPAFAVNAVQGAEMTIEPGGREGGPDNRHQGADQWLYVVAGSGMATVEGQATPLKAGVLIVIERGERHEIKNTGRRPLKTVNLYSPPAYDANGNRLPPGKK
jgi:mannose-6-phosphate isomerase-like protein (cupin superfamily)